MIVGATSDTDKDILNLSSALYRQETMKRACYFMTSHELRASQTVQDLRPERVRRLLTREAGRKEDPLQLKLVFEE